MPQIPPSGWYIEVDHPDTGRTLTPSVLDEPQIVPSINGQPEVRIPVRRDDAWLSPTYDQAAQRPEMRVWRDGERQPIDELRNVTHETGRTILTGVGGVELEQRVQATFDTERRHLAAEQLIQNQTSYTADVDTPVTETFADQLQYSLSTTAAFAERLDAAADQPPIAENDTTTVGQTSFTLTAEEIVNQGAFNGQQVFDSSYADGTAIELTTAGDFIEFDFTLQYDIPLTFESETATLSAFEGAIHAEASATGASGDVDVILDGTAFESVGVTGTGTEWSRSPNNTDAVAAGTHTIRFELTSVDSGESVFIDCANCNDDRFTYDFPDALNADGQLDGPQLYPQVTPAAFTDAVSPFAVVGGSADITMDDTSANQYLQVSNDRGETYLPDDGSETNTTSVDVSFPDDGASIRPRVGLSRYGSRTDATPATGYLAQSLQSLDLFADIEEVLLLLDQDYDSDLASILQDIAGDNEFVWSYNLDADGNPQISWTQPGQRVADRDPDIGDATIGKDQTTYPIVTIKGSPQPESGEIFTASETFVDLAEDDILSGSDAVRDPTSGENFTRGIDYELDRENGRIRILASGDMNSGTDYAIDYRYKIAGAYEAENAPADATELVENVPGVTTERAAEQIAFALVSEFDTPRYTADLEIERPAVDFDVLEALTLANLDLPPEAAPLELRGDPQLTPRGLTARLGSRGRIEEALRPIAEQVSQLADRS